MVQICLLLPRFKENKNRKWRKIQEALNLEMKKKFQLFRLQVEWRVEWRKNRKMTGNIEIYESKSCLNSLYIIHRIYSAILYQCVRSDRNPDRDPYLDRDLNFNLDHDPNFFLDLKILLRLSRKILVHKYERSVMYIYSLNFSIFDFSYFKSPL